MSEKQKTNGGAIPAPHRHTENPKHSIKGRRRPKTEKQPLVVIGWIEHIDLPKIGLLDIRSKIDTGARTSALHATEIAQFVRNGADWVRFHVQLYKDTQGVDLEAPIHDFRHIKNTGGVPEERIVIRTDITIGGQTWPISVSLTDRESMKFPMIVGRSALKRHNIAVHTHKANLHSPATRKKKKAAKTDHEGR